MKSYLLRRGWQSALVLFGVSVVVFLILHLTGDPALLLLPPDSTAEDAIVRDAKRLPRKTESWRPQNVADLFVGLLLIDQNGLIIRLVRIVADGGKGPGKSCKTTLVTNGIGLMFSS